MGKVTDLAQIVRFRRIVRDYEQAGWRIGCPPSADSVPDGPSIYLLDVETGRQFLIVTRTGGIESDSLRLREDGFEHTSAVEGLSGIMNELVGGKTALDDELRGALYLAGEAYVAGTRSYATAREMGLLGSCAFLVLHHEDHQSRNKDRTRSNYYKLLRPVLIPHRRVLSPEMVRISAEQTLAHDRRAHPERFARAKVLPIRVNTPETV